ncbi:RNA-binding domain-containing protein [uncultured Xanthomonas sp.]|uniref:RNA-binding domain-containing protein n=1 Tax=uncultured Xanthomonas sp. TaxID=152831 RepID=UPI0025D30CBD|nr:RNA-binding domain-containing protein [uncultured Xanthomonas sp.]
MSNFKGAVLKKIEMKLIDLEVLEAIIPEGAPSDECELWDYKLLIDDKPESFIEMCRDVVSFYNAYGGYIIFGVSDDLKVVGFDEIPFSAKQIKQKVYSFTSCDVEVGLKKFEFYKKNLIVLFIPKRPSHTPVAVIKKNAEHNGRVLFRLGSVYFRSHESCQIIRTAEDLKFLSTERNHPALGIISTNTLSNNLPDRSMICEEFVGRSGVKEALWLWLSDEMLRYRLLAGPGGVGKTSAAFSFAEDFISTSALGVMQLVWLSAKTKQFSAKQGRYIRLAYSGTSYDSFKDIPSLIDAIIEHLPFSAEEIEEIGSDTQDAKISRIHKILLEIPTFFVLDDLDSLSIDDQRRVIEIAMLVGSRQTRFLITTRKNYLASTLSLQELPGLSGDDFSDYVRVLEARYGREIPKQEMKRFERETGGSPLFAESIFRLLKVGVKFHEAIERWKGEDGEVVRAAAFSKELEQLSTNSRRVLYAVSLFDSCSIAEVKEISELETPQVEAAIIELEQLFLLSSEQIGDEARFSTPALMTKLLHEQRESLVIGHREMDRRFSRVLDRIGISSKGRGKIKYVGRIINQTMALLGEDVDASLLTINEGLRAFPQNADLWMIKARCLSKLERVDAEEVRKAFLKSFTLGKREKDLFEKWIEFEMSSGNSNAAIDVVTKADRALVPYPWEWNQISASAYIKRGRERLGRLEYTDALSDFHLALRRIENAIRFSPLAARSSLQDIKSNLDDLIKICTAKKS